ncbi:hypothetical protein BpHYR1_002096 [Brachionus plicatilis]|uniref:Uncharacterized protein n=1 Tax=Brachionus plicatilis TaxID=10195 RepID=A0A3M7T8T6_BRAPC|nr:hypothetical protein BpHYR1_002096 [Brachionus plicatilis]
MITHTIILKAKNDQIKDFKYIKFLINPSESRHLLAQYNFPCLNSFYKSGLQKLPVIQNTAVRCILKLPLRTSSESLFFEAEYKLNIIVVVVKNTATQNGLSFYKLGQQSISIFSHTICQEMITMHITDLTSGFLQFDHPPFLGIVITFALTVQNMFCKCNKV